MWLHSLEPVCFGSGICKDVGTFFVVKPGGEGGGILEH